ncbi:MAG: beta-ketoacyl synthase chain length factor [Pseudomonadota bacterium]
MTIAMRFQVDGIGLWGRGLTSFATLEALVAGEAEALNGSYEQPKPQAVAPRERRRAGELINLAVEVAHQACEHAGADKRQIPSVFASALSDTAVTDYMCRKLAAPERLLSPTKFHNSVHNAASGYWSISAENRAPSTFISGFRESFGAGLLEAVSLCLEREEPVLYVAYDMANAAPFNDFAAVDESLATAFVLSPAADRPRSFELELLPGGSATAATAPSTNALREIAATNYCGAGLTLAEACATPAGAAARALTLPFTPDRALKLTASAA